MHFDFAKTIYNHNAANVRKKSAEESEKGATGAGACLCPGGLDSSSTGASIRLGLVAEFAAAFATVAAFAALATLATLVATLAAFAALALAALKLNFNVLMF